MNSRNWVSITWHLWKQFSVRKVPYQCDSIVSSYIGLNFATLYFQRFPRDWDIPWDLSLQWLLLIIPLKWSFILLSRENWSIHFSTHYYKTIKLLESNLSLQFLLLCIHYVFTFIKIIFPLCFKHSSSRSPPSPLRWIPLSVLCKYAHFFKRPKLSLIPHILFFAL